MATYVNDLRLKEIATGDEAGTWGTSTNTNLQLIGEALGYGTQDCFASDADATTTVADGATDPARAMYFKVTSSATLTATRTLTIAPNTVSRVMLIENATTGAQSIAISQGSGGNVTIANGAVKMVYLDGAGAGAAVVDALADLELGTITVANLTATTADINGGTIDGATIGGASAAAGTFTTLNATGGGALTGTWSDLGTVTTVDINGGTIDGATIGGASAGAGTFTNLTASGTVSFSGATVSDGGTVTTVDINGGNIDGTVIGAATPAAGSFTSLTATGTTTLAGASTTADITFGDNDKAIFGAGSDLQIYHDGSNSYIVNTQGSLVISDSSSGAGDMSLQTNGSELSLFDSAGSKYMLRALTGGQVDLYHNGSAKLSTTATGIDVTGTITADGLTVDNSGDIRLGFSYSRVADADNAGGFASGYNAYVDGTTVKHDSTGALSAIHYYSTTGVNVFTDESAVAGTAAKKRALFANNGDISFYEDTGTTPKFFWDASAESLGIGTASPGSFFSGANQLVVGSGSGAQGITIYAASNDNSQIFFADGTSGADAYRGIVRYLHNDNAMAFYTDGANERMRIDSSGNLLVGTTSAGFNGQGLPLVVGSGSGNTGMTIYSGATGYGTIQFADTVTTGAGSYAGVVSYNHNSDFMYFSTAASERMRIDSSGNLLVGTTAQYTSSAHIVTNTATATYGICIRDTGQTTGAINFENSSGTQVGNIILSSTTTTYNTSSDYRLKDVDGPITNSGTYIDALKPVQGSWKADGSRFIGLIAHEVQEVSETQIATGEKDGEEMQGMDYSAPELIANLIAEIQSLRARVHALESK